MNIANLNHLSASESELLSGFVPVPKVPGLNTLAQRMIDRVKRISSVFL